MTHEQEPRLINRVFTLHNQQVQFQNLLQRWVDCGRDLDNLSIDDKVALVEMLVPVEKSVIDLLGVLQKDNPVFQRYEQQRKRAQKKR